MIVRDESWCDRLNEAAFGFQNDSSLPGRPWDWPTDHPDPLRLRILKLLTSALEQINGTAEQGDPLGTDSTIESAQRWFTDLTPVVSGGDTFRRVRRGYGEIPVEAPADVDVLPYVHIRERPLVEIPDPQNWTLEEPSGVMELLIQGRPSLSEGVVRYNITDEAYFLMEDVRARLAIIDLDRRKAHQYGAFRIRPKNNTVLRLTVSDGTVEADVNDIPTFFLRVGIALRENQANSTGGG